MHARGAGRQLPREPGWQGGVFKGGGNPLEAPPGGKIPPTALRAPPQVGYELKEEIERKFDKWQEPPPVKQVKPLPAPLDGQRKKRGGRR